MRMARSREDGREARDAGVLQRLYWREEQAQYAIFSIEGQYGDVVTMVTGALLPKLRGRRGFSRNAYL